MRLASALLCVDLINLDDFTRLMLHTEDQVVEGGWVSKTFLEQVFSVFQDLK